MDEALEAQIQKRAYELWEQAGRPDGSHMEFWLAAEKELKGEELDEGLRDSFPASDPASATLRGDKAE